MTDLAAPRFPHAQPSDGLYESYFLKAHHPERPQAFWMRHTIHKRPGRDPIGSVWLTVFDADADEPVTAAKENVPATSLAADGYVRIGDSWLRPGRATGSLGTTAWDFAYATDEPEQRHLPATWMYTAPVPRTKSLTPHPSARFDGALGDYDVTGWTGVVSHNWGTEHAERWIYLHCCHFAGHDEHTWLELVAGRIRLGPLTTPWIANGALQLGGERHRLGGPQRARATKVDEHPTALRFVLTGDGVRVEGELAAPRDRFVGWRYASPDMHERHSLHCSIADLRLHVRRPGRADVELIAPGAATYELGVAPGEPHGIPLQPHEDGRTVRRAALLWLALFAAYAATVGLDAAGDADYAEGEARVLLVAESIVSDSDVDLRDEYRAQAYGAWVEGEIEPVAGLTAERLHEPPGVGLALLVAGPYALAGPVGAELFVAALLALGFVAAAALARRLVPDPWATGGAVVAGLSAPALGWSTAIASEPVAAAAVAGAALYTLRVRDEPTFRRATTAALLIAVLPWLSVKFVPVAVVCAAALARWLRRRRRGLTAFGALEVVLVPTVMLITVNERLYGGLTPYAAVPGDPTGADTASEYAERAERLVTLWIDPGWGLLVWAPFGALAFLALELLVRSLRERLSVALPSVVDVEVTAAFLVALCAAQVAVAAFLSPVFAGDGAFPGRELLPVVPVAAALCAWALRHAPRVGAALAALTLAASAWLLVGARAGEGELAPPSGPLPWAGAEAAVAGAAGAAVVFLLARELWRERALRPG